MTQPKPGVYVYDFGQNLAGVERVRVQGRRERRAAAVCARF